MQIFTFRSLLFIFLCSFSFLAIAQSAKEPETGTKVIPNTLVFKVKPFIRGQVYQSDVLNQALKAIGATTPEQKFPKATLPDPEKPGATDLTLVYEVSYKNTMSLEKMRTILMGTNLLDYVEPLYYRGPLYQPNDPMADSVSGSQYYLKNIKAYRAWDVEKGDSTIVIGILDTGIRFTHQELRNKVAYNRADPIDGIDNDNDGYVDNYRGWDFGDNDNNPTADASGHGIAVTGYAAAEADNAKGIAGVGFHCRYMPIKIYNSFSSGKFGGYEAIVYAADKGCDVINLSWGGPGFYSRFEQDVVTYAAVNKDVVIVAAGGNRFRDEVVYPASYDHVLTVGVVDVNDVQGQFHTYNYKVDLVAPGVGVMTTTWTNDSSYNYGTGSSYAAPIVSGAAGLVRKKFPAYTAAQVAERIRVTTDNISGIAANAPYLDKMGSGRLNVYRALTQTSIKSVRNMANYFANKDKVYAGDTLVFTADFRNFLDPVSNLNITLTSASPFVTVLQGSYAAGSMATLTTKTNTTPFRVVIAPNAPVNAIAGLKYTFTDGTYSDFQYFTVVLNPDYLTVDVNDVAVTINSKGNFGYNGYNFDQGIGFTYKNGPSLLLEGGLMVGAASNKVSDNVRNSQFGLDGDFYPVQNIRKIPGIAAANFEARGIMQDSLPYTNRAGVRVKYRALAWQSAPDNRYVILEYKLTNLNADTLKTLYAGLFADWDVVDYAHNFANWDAVHKMGYVYRAGSSSVYTGIKLLSNVPPSYYALEGSGTPVGTIDISNGFSAAEKYQAISGGVQRTQAGFTTGNDVAHVVGGKIPNLAPNDSAIIAFALIGGDNLTDLQASALAAQVKFDVVVSGLKDNSLADKISVYPNPAADLVTLELLPEHLGSAGATIEIYDMVGHKLQSSLVKQAGKTILPLNKLASGLYLIRINGNQFTTTRKIQVMR